MLDFHAIEKNILEFWEKNKTYEKIKKKNENGEKFYFLQGPPYTSGKLHIGHAWNNSLKDITLRYKRAVGYNVWDRGGYDMHGLPTENKVQAKLGFKFKEEIEKYGIDKFVKECMSFSKEYAGYMSEDLWKLGVWLDHKKAYMPISKDYIDGEWGLIYKAWKQGRLYKGSKIMHWDAQSETSLAKHELEYENIKDMSVFLKFKVKNKENEFLLIWTTTPWTIPFNLGVMVNPDLDYVRIKVDKEYWIIAKALVNVFVSGLLGKKYQTAEEFKGGKLEGLEYVHPLYSELRKQYDSLKKEWKKVHTVLLSKDYVDTTAGTGLVHCAPGCGPEDYEVGKKYGLGAFNTLNERGIFENMGKYSGWRAKEDDNQFIKEFENKGCLLEKTIVEHEYPFSWRSHKPVVFRPTEQWFLKIEDLIPELLKFNKKVNWVPDKAGKSYEQWTKNLKDNGLTRQRYWGCPMPVWVNVRDEKDYFVIGGVEELEKLTKKKYDDLHLHRPFIDDAVIKKGGKEYHRVKDVIDVWIDSGTASWNCLYNDKELIKKWFPADFILEATEQTKLWFNMLQICSAIFFGKSSYENVFVHGMILDYQGSKMSKSLGNVISPYEVIDKYSADILRYYICQITAGENVSFSWEDIKVKQANLIILKNIANYLMDIERQEIPNGKAGAEEKWILSKYHSALNKVTELFDEYRIDETIGEIEKLFLSLSRDYIKIVREKAGENSSVKETIKEVYIGILKMFSTICPFITESIWQELREKKIVSEESVHLCGWPKADKKKINKKLEEEFEFVLKIVELGLAERDSGKIGLRWPLSSAIVVCDKKIDGEMKEIIARQLNVKEIEMKEGKELRVKLDTKMTEELETEGFVRELTRKIQAERKNKGLQKGKLVAMKIYADREMLTRLKRHEGTLKEKTNASNLEFLDGKFPKSAILTTIKEKKFGIDFS